MASRYTTYLGLCFSLLFVAALPAQRPAQKEAAQKALQKEAAQDVAKKALRPRVAVLGASVSNGCSCGIILAAQSPAGRALAQSEEFLGIPLSQEEYLRRSRGVSFRTLMGPHFKSAGVRLLDYSDTMFFMNPRKRGGNQVLKAVKREAQLVFGVDFLFWFVYGSQWVPGSFDSKEAREQARRKRDAAKLQFGLDLIEKSILPSGATIVIGTIPDMRGCDPRVLPSSGIPPIRTVLWANKKIRAFANKHERVLLYPLFQRAAAMRSGSYKIGEGEDARYGSVAGLLQVDMLHATRLGSAVLVYDLLGWLRQNLPKDHVCYPAAPQLNSLLKIAKAEKAFAALPQEPAGKVRK
ncbi:MAG: hypothetical protein CSA62_04950 [Planctomycetota bacterium]|nr:MAG: hypothetical protein CSA62_04950 [Planctomycetota bacterium]